MEKYYINSSDAQIIKQIENATIDIFNLYQKMIMETWLNNGQESLLFLEMQETLKNNKKIEDELYQKLNLTPEKAASIYKTLKLNDQDIVPMVLEDRADQEFILMRITKKIASKADIWFLSKEVCDYEKKQGIDKQELRLRIEEAINAYKYSNSLKLDEINSFLYFNEENIAYLEDMEDDQILPHLFRAKMLLAFLDQDVENTLLDDNFTLNQLILSSDLCGQTLNLSKDVMDSIKSTYYLDGISKNMAKRIVPDRQFTKSLIEKVKQNLMSSHLRGCLVVLNNNEEIMGIREDWHNIYEHEFYNVDANEYNSIVKSVGAINDDLSNFEQDRSKVYYYSMK